MFELGLLVYQTKVLVKIERLIVVKRQGNIRNTAILMMYKCTKMNRVVKKRESWIDVMIATRKRRSN